MVLQPKKIDSASHRGTLLARLGIPGLLGAAAILFFHPGAMEMDRLKWSLLLAAALLLLAVSLRRGLVTTALSPLSPALFTAALLPAFLVLSCLRTGLPALEDFRLTIGLLVLLVAACVVRDGAWERPRLITAVLLAGGALAALYSVAQSAGLEILYTENPAREAVSTLGNTNSAAEVYALLLPLAAAGLFAPKLRFQAVSLAALPILAAGLVATGGRGGLLASLAGLGVVVLVLRKAQAIKEADRSGSGPSRRRRVLILAVVLLAAGAAAAMLVRSKPAPVFKNIETDVSVFSPEYPSNKVRLSIWEGTLDMIGDHPFLGAGPGRFRTAFPPYRLLDEARIRGRLGAVTEVENPHNEFLWAAAEGGVGAAAVLGLFLLLLFRQGVIAVRNAREPGRAYQTAALTGVVTAFTVLCLVRSPLHNPAAACILFLSAGAIEATRFETGAPRGRGPARTLTAVYGIAVVAALTLFGARALWSDLIFAQVGTSSSIGLAEYKKLEHALAVDDGNIELVNFLGQVAARISGTGADDGGKYTADATRLLGQVLERHPNHPGALRSLGRIRLLGGKARAGRHMIERSLALTGSTDGADLAAAGILEQAGRFSEAAGFYKAEWRGRERLLLEHAQSLYDAKTIRPALIFADAFLECRPLDVDGLHLKARGLRELGDGGEDETFRLMQVVIGLEWLESGQWAEAQKAASRSLNYGEGDGAGRLILAVAEAALGKAFTPPEAAIRSTAIRERLVALAGKADLPAEVRTYLEKL